MMRNMHYLVVPQENISLYFGLIDEIVNPNELTKKMKV